MPQTTGIVPDDRLNEFIKKVKSSTECRVMKISIANERLVLDEYKEPSGDWEADYASFVTGLVVERQPCYILFRMDSKKKKSNNYDWSLIVWSPESSPIREKMMLAATKANLKKASIGFVNISRNYVASTIEELSLPSFKTSMEVAKRSEQNGVQNGGGRMNQEQTDPPSIPIASLYTHYPVGEIMDHPIVQSLQPQLEERKVRDMAGEELYNDLRLAAEAHRQTRKYMMSYIKPGMTMIDIWYVILYIEICIFI